MEKEKLDSILESTHAILKTSQDLLDELKAMNEGIAFLQNEYKTNKKYFRLESGKTTIDDVISDTLMDEIKRLNESLRGKL